MRIMTLEPDAEEPLVLVPRDTVTVEKSDGGYVATTSLLEEPQGTGSTEAEAVANLGHSVRAHLKIARDRGLEIPKEFRVAPGRKLLFVALFLVFAFCMRLVVLHLWKVYG